MQVQVAYGFANAQEAYRFLNELKHWSVKDVNARFFRDNTSVQVSYQLDGFGFDSTAAELDDLAASYGGRELS